MPAHLIHSAICRLLIKNFILLPYVVLFLRPTFPFQHAVAAKVFHLRHLSRAKFIWHFIFPGAEKGASPLDSHAHLARATTGRNTLRC